MAPARSSKSSEMTSAPELARNAATHFPSARQTLDLHAAVAALWPRIEGWVPRERRAGVLALCRPLPPIWRWGVLELRLAAGDDRVDVMGCVGAVEQDRALILEHVESEALSPARSVLEAWARSTAWAAVPLLWLEWDLPIGGRHSTLLFACVNQAFLERDSSPPSPEKQLALSAEVLRLSAIEPKKRTLMLEGIARCVAALPGRGRLLHVGPLSPRARAGCRLVVCLRAEELRPWLRAVGWNGDIDAVEDWSYQAAPFWHRLLVHYDVGASEPYLAIETDLAERASSRKTPFTEALTRAGLAQPERLDMARRWPGKARENLCGNQGSQAVSRSVYFKLSFLADRRLEAKAYLGFNLAAAQRRA